ncbi:hypothetical protein [Clostridium sp. D33t1_170424_F3]|uniref:hypothetical protein n=1 Tax=Clostridium sp. D33t1_170424_F3 TaxID=2787099 RepID=UPI0018A8F389|nr:hypothetical protein [Clostridium sp. D33t1_170424_F3]
MDKEMQLAAVKAYGKPEYPVKEEVLHSPDLLKALPKRWHAKPVICILLAFTAASGLCACSEIQRPNTAAPIFAHGDGRGAYGCVSVAAPVFLSEEEAAQVIREEALLQGVDFSGTKSIYGEFPATSLYSFLEEESDPGTWKGTLELDGYDEALGIGFEYVSKQDVIDWLKDDKALASVESYDIKGTAERLADAVDNIAVFYDPTAAEDFDGSLSRTELKKQIKEQLREQVRDFLSWLAGEGLI